MLQKNFILFVFCAGYCCHKKNCNFFFQTYRLIFYNIGNESFLLATTAQRRKSLPCIWIIIEYCL